jgi:hypothetical protein
MTDSTERDVRIRLYMDQVFNILESFDYPSLIETYEIEQVARSMNRTINVMFNMNVSAMKCAVIIWALTMTLQVMPGAANAVKH